MKTLIGILVLLASFVLSACDHPTGVDGKDEKGVGSYDGEFYLDPSVQGSVSDVMVALYASDADLRGKQPMMVTRTNVNGRYFFFDVPAGKYAIEAWKDNDADSRMSQGDYYLTHCGCDGCSTCCVEEECTASFCGKLEVVQ